MVFAENICISKNNHLIVRSELLKSGYLIVDFLALVDCGAGCYECHSLESIVRQGIRPNRLLLAEVHLLTKPAGNGIIPVFETNNRPIGGIVLGKYGIEESSR